MEYGYARISRRSQNIDRQVRNILAVFPDAYIVKEAFTGTRFQGRKELDKLLRVLKAGDTLIFDSASRMSRQEDAVELYEELFFKGIHLVFLKEPHINTDIYKKAIENQIQIDCTTGSRATDTFLESMTEALNRYSVDLAKEQIRLVFAQAEKEVTDLHQRTKEGIQTARLNGKQIGQVKGTKLTTKKSIEAKAKIKKYNKDFSGSLNNEETWTLIGISKMSFYKYKKELFEEMTKK